MPTIGTREWSDWNLNLFKGCSNNCKYCYAKFMAKRFGRIKELYEWSIPVINKKILHQSFRKRKGRGMFPTAHDITPQTYIQYVVVLLRLLRAGNKVLITTKPNYNLIKMLCKQIEFYKDQVQFRFTITSIDDTKLKYWEPNAPNYQSRKASLIYAFHKGFKTSVSIEPYLDFDPIQLINDIALYCTESIWLGIMNPKYSHGYDSRYYNKSIYEKPYVKILVKSIVDIFSVAYPETILKKLRLKDSIRNLGINIKDF